ncbi:tRNA (guanosine(37)-N1)-methyltransferase TrmD [bacterium]|nr:tRNA (guanosine(37)-N1)-methyltransferase TrmD [bacterium]
MWIDVITLFPELVDGIGRYGMVRRAIAGGQLELTARQLRDFAVDDRGSVDDRSYGGGPGMVLRPEPLREALAQSKSQYGEPGKLVYLSPQGDRLTDDLARELAQQPGLRLLCGRYEGVDQRVIDAEVDLELSVGDVVLSGGELPAMLLVEAIARLLPGVLGDASSEREDSFAEGLLDHPHYTRPEQDAWGAPPAVLLSGDHRAIARWRMKQSLGRTWLRRPDLLDKVELTDKQRALLAEYIDELPDTGDGDNTAG